MSIFQSHDGPNIGQAVGKKAFLFGLMSVFLCGIGFNIITPVIPFLIQPYISNPKDQAIAVTLLTSVYAACIFFATSGLGALSDGYRRRPLLLVYLSGSAIGYLVPDIGGALQILSAGRIIGGITGRSISTVFAYFANITPRKQQTKYSGWISVVAGVGAVIGPIVGGLLARFGYSIPMYCRAIITLLSFVYGILYMPESLDKNHHLKEIPTVRLNPFIQLLNVLSIKDLRKLLISAFLLWIPSGALQAVFSQFTIDASHWEPVTIGLVFSIIGTQDILSRGLIVPKPLLKLNSTQIAILGMLSEIIGYSLIAASALFSFYPLFAAGIFMFGFNDSIFGPSFNRMVSKSADSSEQGRAQGSSQSVQILTGTIGPITGGQIYISLGHAAPALMGVLLIAAAILVLYRGMHVTVETA